MRSLYESILDDEEDLVNKEVYDLNFLSKYLDEKIGKKDYKSLLKMIEHLKLLCDALGNKLSDAKQLKDFKKYYILINDKSGFITIGFLEPIKASGYLMTYSASKSIAGGSLHYDRGDVVTTYSLAEFQMGGDFDAYEIPEKIYKKILNKK